ncbi:pyridoxal phosphate-dependent aminotransferase [Pelagicoccus albus]|uniref:Aminotransferase class I/II-fold pyridoxal phosphate-dependent enzyme n=1 Tax=Pelagicoccus albus TaxID=415222 RepID=A0A7X1B960_9BACT|nr:aminotransferase class I/II-fold pyridoxal phosphate-dependent enzyme [Pelagicoccus albus]MBC2606688.1 aminotransferase class I/II-fold pyridoxal phosphate-dependent enzyme [Pelagicoccus albus]
MAPELLEAILHQKKMSMNRRDWIKNAAIAGGSLTLPSLMRAQAQPTAKKSGIGDSTYDFINLSINENQWGPSPKAIKAMEEKVRFAYEYPGVPFQKLRSEIAERSGVEADQVLVGAGSSDILMSTSYVFGKDNSSIVCSDPTFGDLIRWSKRHGTEIISIPWSEERKPDLPKILASIREDTGLIYICNPENPTGTFLEKEALKDFCREASKKCPVFVDEAYIDFAADAESLTMMELVREGLPIIVCRTFSKAHGLGGMRIGYAVTSPEIAKQIGENYVSGVVGGSSHVSLEGARAAYADEEWISYVREQTKKVRDDFMSFCDSIGQEYIPSHTTFMLLPVKKDSKMIADTLYAATKIKISPRMIHGQNYLRISMGNPAQMDLLKTGLRLVLS